MEDLLKQLCNKNPEFLESLNSFPDEIKQEIEKKLKEENDEIKFTSTLAEIDFGLLFNKLGFDLEYEIQYLKKEPDWTLSIGDSKAICEVYRLGKSKNDQFTSKFLSQLTKKVRELKYRYIVRLKILNNDFDTSLYKIDSIIYELNSWLLLSAKIIGDKFILDGTLEFKITNTNSNTNHLICYVSRSIEFKPEKLIQFDYLKKDNKITCKLSKYNEIIREYNYPYFIAIALDFASGFEFEDFEEYFFGKKVGFDCDDELDHEMSLENSRFGTVCTGIFDNNPQLSGLIILDNKKYHLLLNPLKSQIIYDDTNKLILDNFRKIII